MQKRTKAAGRTELTPGELLSQFPPEVRDLAEQLREIVKATVPEASEKAYPGWRGIGYQHPEYGFFCAIFPFNEIVKLGLEYGAFLSDPDGLLEGQGKQVRYVSMRRESDIKVGPLQALLLAALKPKQAHLMSR